MSLPKTPVSFALGRHRIFGKRNQPNQGNRWSEGLRLLASNPSVTRSLEDLLPFGRHAHPLHSGGRVDYGAPSTENAGLEAEDLPPRQLETRLRWSINHEEMLVQAALRQQHVR